MEDTFISSYIKRLLGQVRTQGLLKFIKPYTRMYIPFAAKTLNIPEDDLEALLVSLILDGKIKGHIDQVTKNEYLQNEEERETGGRNMSPLTRQGIDHTVFVVVHSSLNADLRR